jgi:hypothetical protein
MIRSAVLVRQTLTTFRKLPLLSLSYYRVIINFLISAHGQLSDGLRSFVDIHADGEVAPIPAIRDDATSCTWHPPLRRD